MNKYLKLLALSSSVLGAVGITAINPTESKDEYIGNIYQDIEKMQEIVPKLSKINYKLDVNAVQDENVKFISTDDVGVETDLSNEETITYLNETLEQTNIEYEQLRQTLLVAIQDAMGNLEQYKNGETELTNEQKIYIKEHANSIKYLAEILEDLSEDIICCVDGCSDCDDEEEFNEATSKYISAINSLESRIEALQSSLHSLQFINGIANPYFYGGYRYSPNHIIYERYYNKDDDSNNAADDDTAIQDEQNNEDISSNDDILSDAVEDEQSAEDTNIIENNSSDENLNTNNEATDNTLAVENSADTDEDEEKPTTFGLKSNIDTYAPTKRNIDTFFNTALANNEYNNMYGGYGPYGYGGGYGYGMPYGGNYGHPYGMSGLNSNVVNREVMDNNYQPNSNVNTSDYESEKDELVKPKKVRAKRAKNIDTYTGITVQSNINTMGESKISRFFKEKFNNLRNKVKKHKNEPLKNENINKKSNNEKMKDIESEKIIDGTDAIADINENKPQNQEPLISEDTQPSSINTATHDNTSPNPNIATNNEAVEQKTSTDPELKLNEEKDISAK